MGEKLTEARTYDTPARMPRAKVFPIRITLPLTAEMLQRTDEALADGEDRVSLIRKAIEAELKRRARQK